LEAQLRPLPSEIRRQKDKRKRDPLIKPLPLWIANHAQFPDKVKERFDKFDHEKPKDRPADRPWSRLNCLKGAFQKAADDIEKEHKLIKAKSEDSLPILIAVARLMDKPYLDANGF
jgi:hypothetical protein